MEEDDASEVGVLRPSLSASSLPDIELADMSPRSKKRRFSLGRLARKSPRTRSKYSPRDTDSETEVALREASPHSRRRLSRNNSRRDVRKPDKKAVKDSERLEKQLAKIDDPAVRKCFKLQANETLRRLKDLYDMNVEQADVIAKLRADADRGSVYRQAQRPPNSNTDYFPMYVEHPPQILPGGTIEVERDARDDDGCGCIVM